MFVIDSFVAQSFSNEHVDPTIYCHCVILIFITHNIIIVVFIVVIIIIIISWYQVWYQNKKDRQALWNL